MQLAGGGVGEEQEQVAAELPLDQLGRRGRLSLAHAVGLQRDVQDVDPFELGDALGGVGQGRVARGAGQARLAEVRVEVQHLDEQGADGGGPLARRRGEDARDALLDLGRVVTVLDGHAPFLSKSGLPQV